MRPLALAVWDGIGRIAPPVLYLVLRRRLAAGREVAGRLAERRGVESRERPHGRLIWLHAASVGETVSILGVLAALVRQAPDVTVLVTTGTVTSAELLAGRVAAMGVSERVLHRFVPLDVPAWAARFLDHWRPDAGGFVESELWPNLLAACAVRNIPMMLLNARMSARSFARWRRLPRTARVVLGFFKVVQARSGEDGARLAALGARGVTAPGDLKFAADPLPADAAELARLRGVLAGRPVWAAANTHPGEEAIVVEAHRLLAAEFCGLVTIIAPRHPGRGAAIAAAVEGVAVTRRALGQDPPATGVWVADRLGELGLVYRLAGLAFIGRSLAVGGGQNPLEAARLGCAIAAGPQTDHQAEGFAMLERAGVVRRVEDAAGLADWVRSLWRDPDALQRQRDTAAAAAAGSSDLPQRTAATLIGLLGG